MPREPAVNERTIPKFEWIQNPEYPTTWDCFDEKGQRVAYLSERPTYCDRGHFLGNVEIGGLDSEDCWPNYYMDFERAKNEIISFLLWRLYKISSPKPLMLKIPMNASEAVQTENPHSRSEA